MRTIHLGLTSFLMLASHTALAADTYRCVSKDEETGYSITAAVTINGAAADVSLSSSGMPGCQSVPALTVKGKAPIFTLTGSIVCDGEEPEDVTLELNTSKKTLALGETVFNCR